MPRPPREDRTDLTGFAQAALPAELAAEIRAFMQENPWTGLRNNLSGFATAACREKLHALRTEAYQRQFLAEGRRPPSPDELDPVD